MLAWTDRDLPGDLRCAIVCPSSAPLTSRGDACNVSVAMPQDAIEPLRRMCKWIVEERCDPEVVFPMWKLPKDWPA